MYRCRLVLFALPLLFCLAGCGRASRASVSGRVSYRDVPLPAGTVSFIAQDSNVVESAPIQNGQYTIARAPLGPVKVTVTTPPAANATQMGQRVPGKTIEGGADKVVPVPAEYGNPEQSGLRYTVTKEEKQTFDIPLK